MEMQEDELRKEIQDLKSQITHLTENPHPAEISATTVKDLQEALTTISGLRDQIANMQKIEVSNQTKFLELQRIVTSLINNVSVICTFSRQIQYLNSLLERNKFWPANSGRRGCSSCK